MNITYKFNKINDIVQLMRGYGDLMGDLLNIVTQSEKRKNLLLLLKSGPRTWDEIKTDLQVTSTGMLPQIKILIERNLLLKIQDKYFLTDIGKTIVHYLDPLSKIVDIVGSQESYWTTHDYSALPLSFRMMIGDLGKIHLNIVDTEEILEPPKEFLENIRNSKFVCGLSPVMYPSYPRFFVNCAKEGMNVTIVMTKVIFDKVRSEYKEELVEGFDVPNLHLYTLDKQIKFACIVTDTYLWLSLFDKNGTYDPRSQLISYDPSARIWGEKLIKNFMGQSLQISQQLVDAV